VIQNITPLEAHRLLATGQVDLVDVRESHEWSKGHLPGARHVPLQTLRSNPANALPRDGVIFVCAAGVRSEAAARVAAANGLQSLYNLNGGTQGWTRAGLPLSLD
jgi:rhodanese-related sulfurtransferase